MKLIETFKDKGKDTVWVILGDDGKTLYWDPEQPGTIWSTKSLQEAKRVQTICLKDFQVKVHVRTLEEAITTIAKKRYDIDLTPPYTWKNISQQLIELTMKGKFKNGSH